MRTLYDILGIPKYSDGAIIRKAYLEQVKYFHPDVFEGSPEVAKIKTQELNEAYRILTDPRLKFEYDQELFAREEEERRKQEQEAREEEERKRREQEEQEKYRNEPNNTESNSDSNTESNTNTKAEGTKSYNWVFLLIIFIFMATSFYFASECKDMGSQISRMEQEIETRKQTEKELRADYSAKSKENKELKTDLRFWEENAAIVTEYGEKYHRQGCYHIEGKKFWILGKNSAVLLGYDPCLTCYPSNFYSG